jgi:histone-lysine N-methyltransferase MLL3
MNIDQDDNHFAIRIGSLVLYNIGQLLPHQINSEKFHTRDFIYPVSRKGRRIEMKILIKYLK